MSLYDYNTSLRDDFRGAPFYALIMAAMRRASSTNAAKLKKAFPDTWAELQRRYDSPGGRLPEDGS